MTQPRRPFRRLQPLRDSRQTHHHPAQRCAFPAASSCDLSLPKRLTCLARRHDARASPSRRPQVATKRPGFGFFSAFSSSRSAFTSQQYLTRNSVNTLSSFLCVLSSLLFSLPARKSLVPCRDSASDPPVAWNAPFARLSSSIKRIRREINESRKSFAWRGKVATRQRRESQTSSERLDNRKWSSLAHECTESMHYPTELAKSSE